MNTLKFRSYKIIRRSIISFTIIFTNVLDLELETSIQVKQNSTSHPMHKIFVILMVITLVMVAIYWSIDVFKMSKLNEIYRKL